MNVALKIQFAERKAWIEFVAFVESSPYDGVVVHDDAADMYFRFVAEVGVAIFGVPAYKAEIASCPSVFAVNL